MQARGIPTSVRRVDIETGANLRQRRVALGISVRKLAELAGVDRSRVAAIEAGDSTVRETTIGAVESALSAVENDRGVAPKVEPIGDPSQGLVTFEIRGNFGVQVVVKGPVADVAALEASVAKLVADMQKSGEVREEG